MVVQRNPDESPLMSRVEAARYLRVSTRTLHDLTVGGSIQVVRLSDRRIAYLRKDLDQYIERSRSGRPGDRS